MNSSEHQEPSSRRGVLAWALWVLVSALGGVLGGPVMEISGFLGLLFGGILGAAQALILPLYLRDPTGSAWGIVVLWVLVSFSGWFAGSIAIAVGNVVGYYLTWVPGVTELGSAIVWLVGTEDARTVVPAFSLTWVGLAAFQSMMLALMIQGLGRRVLLTLATLWGFAGAAGGVLGVVASRFVEARVFSNDGGDFFLDRILPIAVEQAAAGALYGAATGVVLASVARRMPPPDRLIPELLQVSAGLVAFLVLCVVVPFGLKWSCSDEQLAVFEEFPEYGGQEIEPEPDVATSACIIRFTTTDPEEEVFTYYSEKLRENGWEVEREPPPYSEVTESTKPGATTAARIQSSGLSARRGGYLYRISYTPQPRSGDARVVIAV